MTYLIKVLLVLALFGCTHYPSDVEIVYKNPNRAGYGKSDGNVNEGTYKAQTSKQPKNEENLNDIQELEELTENEEPIAEVRATPEQAGRIQRESKLSIQRTENNNPEYHTVEAGETYYSIARLYNITVRELFELNDYQEGDILKPNTTLKVRRIPNYLGESRVKSAENLTLAKSEAPSTQNTLSIKQAKSSQSSTCQGKFSYPTKARDILVHFGEEQSGGVKSDGIIFSITSKEPIRASESGEVAYIGNDFANYNKIVILKHDNNYFSIYGHLTDVKLKNGQFLNKGDIVSYTSPEEGKFYFAVRKGKTPIKPELC
jgi:LysM repeat protein